MRVTAARPRSRPARTAARAVTSVRHSSAATPATSRNVNSVSDSRRCSSSIWYASNSTGAATAVPAALGAHHRPPHADARTCLWTSAYSSTAVARPMRCWTAATAVRLRSGDSAPSITE
ncbi:hypothetical protein ACFQHO_17075 [Actinomadura yumaensis]|uniref:hypothetical protein n=1 Tax=Actinomadura yumaensis TaxID=111807 RepID=UPI003608E49A